MNYSSFDEELDAIRVAIYEEIKDMTPKEHIAYVNAQVAPIHEKYNIRVVNKIKSDSERHKEYAAS
jgi:hypothetical protein